MKIKEVFNSGLRIILKNTKFLWLFWMANFLFALVLSLPIFFLLNQSLSHSTVSDKLVLGFDYIWYLQFKAVYKTSISEIPFLIYGVVGVYILIQVFFLGGLLSVFHIQKKNHYVDFFYGGVKYWYRFVKLLFISLFFYALAFTFNDYTGYWLSYWFSGEEKLIFEFILRASRYAFLIFMIGAVSLISDYIKIALVVNDSNSVIKQIYSVLIFLKENFYFTFIVFFLVAVLGALGALVYNLLDSYIPKTEYFYLILVFILQQLLIIFRLVVRMLFAAAEIIIYKDLNAKEVQTNAEELI